MHPYTWRLVCSGSPPSFGAAAAHSDGYGGPADTEAPPIDKEKPDFGTSGLLAEETNKVNGVVVVYTEPPEARMVSCV